VLAEGDGISILVEVVDIAAARLADAQGAEAVVLRHHLDGVREATTLPVIWSGRLDEATDADAVVIDLDGEGERLEDVFQEAHALGVECVLRARHEDDLEKALDAVDPEILLLSADGADTGEQLERLLELLPDVPAGKLAIAELVAATRDDVAELERAGVDAVLVTGGDIDLLVGDAPPQV
jgi:indole-3-glycerol phosphate synthase